MVVWLDPSINHEQFPCENALNSALSEIDVVVRNGDEQRRAVDRVSPEREQRWHLN